MEIELINVRALEGPNIFFSQPAVALAVRGERDLRSELTRRIKEWAQAVGLVVGYIRGDSHLLKDGGALTRIAFVCSLPAIGRELGAAVVADLQAEERGDAEYSHDQLLLSLIRRRQREDLPLPLLQLRAEALARRVALFRRPDGRLMLGLGARGWSFDPAEVSLGLPIDPPWERIGDVPLIAIGGAEAELMASQLADALRARGRSVALGAGNFAACRTAMADEQAESVVLTIDPAMVLEHGLPFERCTIALAGSLEGLDAEAERAAGLHALTAGQDGYVVINADDRAALALLERIGASAVLVSDLGLTAPLAAYVAQGGLAVWRDEQAVTLAAGERRKPLQLARDRCSLMVLAALEVLE